MLKSGRGWGYNGKISSKDGLVYLDATLVHGNGSITLKYADTGSCATVISRHIAHSLGMKPEPKDIINSVQGVGGSESVIEKKIDAIYLDVVASANSGNTYWAMNYCIELEAIIGLDLENYTLTAMKE